MILSRMIRFRNMRFSRLMLILVAAITFCPLPSYGYDNPVIKGFHPDPSVCAVGEDY